jgi:hypothetical protein
MRKNNKCNPFNRVGLVGLIYVNCIKRSEVLSTVHMDEMHDVT